MARALAWWRRARVAQDRGEHDDRYRILDPFG
jgi:hypothetical protein